MAIYIRHDRDIDGACVDAAEEGLGMFRHSNLV